MKLIGHEYSGELHIMILFFLTKSNSDFEKIFRLVDSFRQLRFHSTGTFAVSADCPLRR